MPFYGYVTSERYLSDEKRKKIVTFLSEKFIYSLNNIASKTSCYISYDAKQLEKPKIVKTALTPRTFLSKNYWKEFVNLPTKLFLFHARNDLNTKANKYKNNPPFVSNKLKISLCADGYCSNLHSEIHNIVNHDIIINSRTETELLIRHLELSNEFNLDSLSNLIKEFHGQQTCSLINLKDESIYVWSNKHPIFICLIAGIEAAFICTDNIFEITIKAYGLDERLKLKVFHIEPLEIYKISSTEKSIQIINVLNIEKESIARDGYENGFPIGHWKSKIKYITIDKRIKKKKNGGRVVRLINKIKLSKERRIPIDYTKSFLDRITVKDFTRK